MLVWGNTGCAVWFNLILGGFGIIGGIGELINGGKETTAFFVGGGFFLLLGLACLSAKRDSEKKAAETVQGIYQQAYAAAATDIEKKNALTAS